MIEMLRENIRSQATQRQPMCRRFRESVSRERFDPGFPGLFLIRNVWCNDRVIRGDNLNSFFIRLRIKGNDSVSNFCDDRIH